MENFHDLQVVFDITLGELPYSYIRSAYVEMQDLINELNQKL